MKKNVPAKKPAGVPRTTQNGSRTTQTGHQATSTRRKRPMPRKKKAIIAATAVLAALLLLIAGGFVYIRILAGKMNYVDPGKETIPEEFNPPTESLVNPVPTVKGVINILLLGVDTRDSTSFSERSDSMMILTIDRNSGKVKLASLQRDMLVYIPGVKEPDKINSANALGGPMLAVRVVNETFRLDIEKYMVVNMQGMEQIIDLAGGIWIDVTRSEVPHITPPISGSGLQKLNGSQAVAYSRIRAIDNDYQRMGRQRTVMQALFDAFLKADLITKNNMISEGLGLISTNMKADEVMNIGINMLPRLDSQIDQLQIPIPGYFKEYSGSSWVNLCDFNGMIPLLQEFIYGRTYPFDPVRIIPGAPNSGVVLATPTPRPTEPAQTTTAVTTTTETRPVETTVKETTVAETTVQETTVMETTTVTTAATTTASTEPVQTTALVTSAVTDSTTILTTLTTSAPSTTNPTP